MGDQQAQVQPVGRQHVHQAAHALLAAGAQRGVDLVIAQARGKGRQRNLQVFGIHAQARQRAAGLDGAQRRFKCGLRAQRLDGGICTTATGDLHDLVDHIAVLEVQRDIGAHLLRNAQAVVVAVHRNDGGGAQQARTGRGAQANGALGKHHHRVTDADVGVFGPLETGGHDVGAHQHLLVRQAIGNGREVGLRIGHQHVLGLGAVNQVAKAPASGGLEAVAAAHALGDEVAAVLRRRAVLRGVGVEVGADRPGNHALAFCVAHHGAAQLFDHTHGFVAHGQALGHRVFALEDVHVRAADGGGRDADQGIVGAHRGDGLADQLNAARFNEDGGFHGAHGETPWWFANARARPACSTPNV